MLLPLAIGAGVAAVLLLASGSASAAERRSMARLEVVVPSRRKRSQGPVVAFTTKLVPWRRSRRTGKVERRVLVEEKPEDLAAAASSVLGRKVTPEALVLAALGASEAAQDLAKVAVMHAALTKAGGRARLLRLLAPDGHLGSQHGRYATTRWAPSVRDVELAEAVLAGRLANPVPGADQWDSPATQDRLAASGAPGYVNKDGSPRDAAFVESERRRAGKEPVGLPGVPEGEFRLWRRAA